MLAYREEPDIKKKHTKPKTRTAPAQEQSGWRACCCLQQNLLWKSSEKMLAYKGGASPEYTPLHEDLATVALPEAGRELGCAESVVRSMGCRKGPLVTVFWEYCRLLCGGRSRYCKISSLLVVEILLTKLN